MKIKPAEKSGGVIVELGPKETQLSATASGTEGSALALFQLKRILVPVDFTRCTEKALLYAVPFARQFDAELTLLHVIELPVLTAFEAGPLPDADPGDGAERELKELRSRVDSRVRCDCHVRRGSAEYEIVAAAKELDCDLIILAAHSRTGLERFVLGSTAEKVVRRAGCPVLIVREKEHEFIAGSGNEVVAAESGHGSEL